MNVRGKASTVQTAVAGHNDAPSQLWLVTKTGTDLQAASGKRQEGVIMVATGIDIITVT
jgi:hypothetical protein